MKTILGIGLSIAIVCVIASIVILNQQPAQPILPRIQRASTRTSTEPAGKESRQVAVSTERPTTDSLVPAPQIPQENSEIASDASRPKTAVKSQAYQDPDLNNPVVLEHWGRVALSFVGVDPQAEEVWTQAINNPNLTDETRQNLIEDLNEDGFADPSNPTLDELPLIVSRIELIQEMAPDAMDETNAAAFMEAYKDLVNMWTRLVMQ